MQIKCIPTVTAAYLCKVKYLKWSVCYTIHYVLLYILILCIHIFKTGFWRREITPKATLQCKMVAGCEADAGGAVVHTVSPPVERSCRWRRGGRDSWPLQVGWSTNRKEAVPQVLAGPATTVSLPGGERRTAICPPACPFTACLTALALRECWARLGWASIGRGALSVHMHGCVCVRAAPSTLQQTRRTTQWTVSQPVSQQPHRGMLQHCAVLQLY